MSTVVTEEVQQKLLDYIKKQYYADAITSYQRELLEKPIYNCNRSMYRKLFEDLAGPNVSDATIRNKADEWIDSIILEDLRPKLDKCSSHERVREKLKEWFVEFSDE